MRMLRTPTRTLGLALCLCSAALHSQLAHAQQGTAGTTVSQPGNAPAAAAPVAPADTTNVQAPAAAPAPAPAPAPQPVAPPGYAPPPPPGAYYAVPPDGQPYPPAYEYDDRYQRRAYRHHAPRRSRGLMIAGIVLFGVSYVVPAIIGGFVGSLNDDTCDCIDAYRMFIPIAGPLTLLHNDRDYRGLNALLITDTVLQSAGLVMTIFGIIRFIASGHDDVAQLREPRLQLVTAPTPSGGYAALRWRL